MENMDPNDPNTQAQLVMIPLMMALMTVVFRSFVTLHVLWGSLYALNYADM